MDMEKLVELRMLRAGYVDRCLVMDANAVISAGETVTLLGPNGAGKSTLLKTICGELPALGGSAMVCGHDTSAVSRRELSRLLSVVSTERVGTDGLNVYDLVSMGRYPYTGFFGRLDSVDRRIVNESLEAVGMGGYARRSVVSLSDGERQKVMVARALAQTTPVIILDEPTAFLDVASRVELNSLLMSLAREQGKAVLLTSHDVAQALEQSTRIWMLTGGGAMVDATPRELLAAHDTGAAHSPLDELFAGRAVVFDSVRMDYRPKV